MRIGIADLDTSHPASWMPIEREMGHEIVGVWDGGSVHPAGYAEKFAAEHGVSRVFDSLEQMVPEVDCAIIHSCDWDTHVEKARPFIEAGKSVLIDKPLAGNLRDLKKIREWARQGARVTGGSSLRFCAETRDWLAQPPSERGEPHTAFCGCGVDEFNYGIHAYSMLCQIMGPGARSVRHLSQGVQRRITVNWDGGRAGFLVVGGEVGWLPFYACIVTEKTSVQYQADGGRLYRSQLEAALPYLFGETDESPVPPDALIEPELCALAALKSWSEDDREVTIEELTEADAGYDGAEFARQYRKAKYPEQR